MPGIAGSFFVINMPKHKSNQGHRRPMKRRSGKKLTTKSWSVNAQAKPAPGIIRMENKPYNFYATVDLGVVLTTSAGGEVDYGYGFTLNSIGNYTQLQQLFDQYRLVEIELWITPTYQNYAGGNSAARYLSGVDYDNGSAVTVAALTQYANVVDVSATCGVYFKFKPHLPATSQGSQALNMVNAWLDCASAGVSYYGIKISAPATAVTYTLNLTYRAHYQFRNVI